MADHEDTPSAFAAQVLRKLLWHIAVRNVGDSAAGHDAFPVLYAWAEGSVLYVVHRAPASGLLWGLARDTGDSPVGPGPWHVADDPARYYFLLDFQEGWAGPLTAAPEEDLDVIRWRGDQLEGLPERMSSIPEAYRYEPSQLPANAARRSTVPTSVEPPRYADPR